MGSTVWVVEVLIILGVSCTMLGFRVVVSTGVLALVVGAWVVEVLIILGVSCTMLGFRIVVSTGILVLVVGTE